jgi:geranylgeranyl diphosphate synthase type II
MRQSVKTFDMETYWQQWRSVIDKTLLDLTPVQAPERLWESVRYSLNAGGKRLRPLLTLATLEALGKDPHRGLIGGCAVELIHTQSLIHDDLPAMDNDDLRRGKPTNHKVFGEAQAILAGDAMLAYAFVVLARDDELRANPACGLAVVEELAQATALGMVPGQVVDMASEGLAPTPDLVRYIHTHKTGALIKAAVRIGALLGSADAAQRAALDDYADSIGLAFQVADDILDTISTAGTLGKTPGKDQNANKATFVSAYGIEGARTALADATDQADKALVSFGVDAEPLRAIARFIHQQVAL